MTNRNAIKQWSITFPQCADMERKAFADMFPPHESVIVSREEHADGGYHLHMGIKLKKGLKKKTLLTWIEKKFPNDFKRIDIQPTRSIHCWSEYIGKEDPEMYVEEEKSNKAEKLMKIRNWILENTGYDVDNPIDVLQSIRDEREREYRRHLSDLAGHRCPYAYCHLCNKGESVMTKNSIPLNYRENDGKE